jgi:hypothetical protein
MHWEGGHCASRGYEPVLEHVLQHDIVVRVAQRHVEIAQVACGAQKCEQTLRPIPASPEMDAGEQRAADGKRFEGVCLQLEAVDGERDESRRVLAQAEQAR